MLKFFGGSDSSRIKSNIFVFFSLTLAQKKNIRLERARGGTVGTRILNFSNCFQSWFTVQLRSTIFTMNEECFAGKFQN